MLSDWVMAAIGDAVHKPDGISFLVLALSAVSPNAMWLEARLLRGVEAAYCEDFHAVAIP